MERFKIFSNDSKQFLYIHSYFWTKIHWKRWYWWTNLWSVNLWNLRNWWRRTTFVFNVKPDSLLKNLFKFGFSENKFSGKWILTVSKKFILAKKYFPYVHENNFPRSSEKFLQAKIFSIIVPSLFSLHVLRKTVQFRSTFTCERGWALYQSSSELLWTHYWEGPRKYNMLVLQFDGGTDKQHPLMFFLLSISIYQSSLLLLLLNHILMRKFQFQAARRFDIVLIKLAEHFNSILQSFPSL